jgi:hypothetical protein
MTCSIQTIVVPALLISRISATSSRASCSVSPPAISSRSSSFGCVASARASSSAASRSVRRPAARSRAAQAGGQASRSGVRLVLAHRRAEHRRGKRVLEHGHGAERLRDRVRAPDAPAAPVVRRGRADLRTEEADRARIRAQVAGDQVEERGLAGAVRADDADELAARDREAQVVDDPERAE